MKAIKKSISILILLFVMTGFSQCSSTKKLQDKAPVEITEIYYKRWAAGMRGGGAGVNLFITIKESEVHLDSVYFRGQATALERNNQYPNIYIGRFITIKEQFDITMSNDSLAEYGNKLPNKEEIKIPFELNLNECVVSYLEGKKIKYFKIKGIKEREVKEFPMSRKQ